MRMLPEAQLLPLPDPSSTNHCEQTLPWGKVSSPVIILHCLLIHRDERENARHHPCGKMRGRKRERDVGGEEQERVRGEVMEEGAPLKYRFVSPLIFNFWILDTKTA